MRDVLDCGVLLAPGHEAAMAAWIAGHQARLARVRLHPVPLAPHAGPGGADAAATTAGAAAAPDTLARLAVSLRRYDGCILPVAPSSLAWTRMALQQASRALDTPILLLVHEVKAPAILDLLTLGAADFIAQPACPESLRVRLDRLARAGVARGTASSGGVRELAASYEGAPAPAARAVPPGPGAVCAPASARPRVAAEIVEQALSRMRHQYRRTAAQESFRAAKAQVVNGFEREYIRHALSRHGGNVAQAARACAKHRRAFWALMRKHGIQAAPYRQAAQAAGHSSGDD